jgi:hypothetical protein
MSPTMGPLKQLVMVACEGLCRALYIKAADLDSRSVC